MKIIYTYCPQDNFTFSLDKFFFKKMIEVALHSSALQTTEIFIYTNKEGKKYLQKNVVLPKNTVFELVDYSKYNWDKRFWNFSKLITYSFQKEAFLHIDLDIFLLPDFVKQLPQSGDILTEKLRSFAINQRLQKYNPRSWGHGNQGLICSGIIGGFNLLPFQMLYQMASQLCKPQPENEIIFEDLYGVEEFLLTCMASQYKYTINPVPANEFVHWQGKEKYACYNHEVEKLHNRLLKNNYKSFSI